MNECCAMNDFLIAIGTAIVSGIAVALVWAGMLALWSRSRNRALEKEIRESLSRIGIRHWVADPSAPSGHIPPITMVGVTVHNDTDVAVTIRGVLLVLTENETLHLNPPDGNDDDRHGFVELRPWTDGSWGSPYGRGAYPLSTFCNRDVIACRIEAHYLTLFGKPKRLRVEIPRDARGGTIGGLWKLLSGQFPTSAEKARPTATPEPPGDAARGDTAPDV